MGGIVLSIEPFIFLGCIVCFLLPILLRRYLEIIQFIAGVLLVLCILVFHEDLQVKIIFLMAFIWAFGSISGLSIRIKK